MPCIKFSVITVCYNSGKTIGATLRSVREQTHKNIEHIIIDGGSMDNTLEVLAIEGLHVSHIISEKDEGIYDAMNKGLKLATGDVIAFLNADDYYIDQSVLADVAQIMVTENLDVLYGDVIFFSLKNKKFILRRYNSGRFSISKLGLGWMPAHPALFIRKFIFKEVGVFRTDYRIAGDFEFIVRVFNNLKIKHRHWAKALVCMQIGGISTSGWRATFLINREMISACRINGISTNWLKISIRYFFKIFEFIKTSI
jgi:glycosyltransferase involved in cell wall biosynthesis